MRRWWRTTAVARCTRATSSPRSPRRSTPSCSPSATTLPPMSVQRSCLPRCAPAGVRSHLLFTRATSNQRMPRRTTASFSPCATNLPPTSAQRRCSSRCAAEFSILNLSLESTGCASPSVILHACLRFRLCNVWAGRCATPSNPGGWPEAVAGEQTHAVYMIRRACIALGQKSVKQGEEQLLRCVRR